MSQLTSQQVALTWKKKIYIGLLHQWLSQFHSRGFETLRERGHEIIAKYGEQMVRLLSEVIRAVEACIIDEEHRQSVDDLRVQVVGLLGDHFSIPKHRPSGSKMSVLTACKLVNPLTYL